MRKKAAMKKRNLPTGKAGRHPFGQQSIASTIDTLHRDCRLCQVDLTRLISRLIGTSTQRLDWSNVMEGLIDSFISPWLPIGRMVN